MKIDKKTLKAQLKEARGRAKNEIELTENHREFKGEEYGRFDRVPEKDIHLTRAEKTNILRRAYLGVFSQSEVSEGIIRDYIVDVGPGEMLFGQSYQAATEELKRRAKGRVFVK